MPVLEVHKSVFASFENLTSCQQITRRFLTSRVLDSASKIEISEVGVFGKFTGTCEAMPSAID